jgi:hypothetical protein
MRVLQVEIADLEGRLAAATDPGERVLLQLRLDARRQEWLTARQADANLRRRAGGR